METDAELLARYVRVKREYDETVKASRRMRLGSAVKHGRFRKAMWAGCLNFTLLGVQAEIEERGLQIPTVC